MSGLLGPRSVESRGCESAGKQSHQPGEKAAAAATKTLYVNTIPWLCTKSCSPITGSMGVYSDQWHITVTYATYLSTVLGDSIKKLLT